MLYFLNKMVFILSSFLSIKVSLKMIYKFSDWLYFRNIFTYKVKLKARANSFRMQCQCKYDIAYVLTSICRNICLQVEVTLI